MENEIKTPNYFEKIKELIIVKKKIFISLIVLSFIIFVTVIYSNYNQNLQNTKIASDYIKADIYLSQKNRDKSKKTYEEIIFKKNKFYSPLALYKIIENNLEDNNDKILKYFDVLEKINFEVEQKNLVKLKKAFFLIKISKKKEGKKLLDELTSDNSIWKNTALGILK